MTGEGIVPPQGMNVINEKRTIYGLPLAVPVGAAGTRVTVKEGAKAKNGSGMSARITAGTYSPTVMPPPLVQSTFYEKNGGGQIVRVVTPTRAPNASAIIVKVITPVTVKQGSGMVTIKTSI